MTAERIAIAVFGAHLSGERLNPQLTALGARLAGACRTAPCYRLFVLPDGRPALLRVAAGGAAILGELWHLAPGGFGRFVAAIPAPLGIGRVRLEEGREAAGFLCEAYAVDGAEEITRFGGWRAWRDARDQG